MSEQRLDSLDRAVSRLLQAQREALEACEVALGDREILDDQVVLDDADVFFDAPRSPVEKGTLHRAALENVRAILVGASEDVHIILGEGDGSGD